MHWHEAGNNPAILAGSMSAQWSCKWLQIREPAVSGSFFELLLGLVPDLVPIQTAREGWSNQSGAAGQSLPLTHIPHPPSSTLNQPHPTIMS